MWYSYKIRLLKQRLIANIKEVLGPLPGEISVVSLHFL